MAQQSYLQKINKQFAAGAIDRLAFTQANIAAQQADADLLQAQFETLSIANDIENMLQYPLNDSKTNNAQMGSAEKPL